MLLAFLGVGTDEPDFPKRLSLQKARAVREAIVAIRASTERPKLRPLR